MDARGDGQLRRLDQIPGYQERHVVRPGLTGLTQVYAPRDISRTSKFRLDRLYLKRASFWLDLKLILLTARYSFVPFGFDSERIRMNLLKEGQDELIHTVPSAFNRKRRN